MRGIVVDIETTGYSKNDTIISIALIKFHGWRVEEILSSLVNPQRNIPAEITGLTGIDNMKVLGAPIFNQLSEDILVFIENLPILAYNAPFEVRFLGSAFQKTKFEVIDILKQAKKSLPNLSSYRLIDVCLHLGIKLGQTHTALGDAIMSYQLVNVLENRGVTWQS